MNFSDCEVVPSVIYNVDDPLKLGRIKCVIPGYVDNTTMSLENMPWVRPWFMWRHQSFSKPVKGFKVWVIINKANYNEYWYIPLYEYNDITKEYLEDVYDNDQPEIFMSHNNGGNHAMFTYDEKNGYNEKIGQHHIELHPDGHISIVGGQHQVDIDGEVKVGASSGSYERAVKGETLKKEILDELSKYFGKLAQACTNPYTAPLAPWFSLCQSTAAKGEMILSKDVKIS